jgi:Enterobacter phage Enc34, ssDNA-binding protein
MAEKIMIKNARLSFPSLFSKNSFQGSEGKYEATLLFPKSDTKTYKKIMAAIEDVKTEGKLGKIPASKLCIKDGDGIEYDGYEDMWAVKASNTKRPTVLDRDKSPITEEDDILYAGCYVNAIISPWGQNNDFGKRVNANILGVQFVKDGEAFGDAVTADADDFDEVEGEEDEDL